jgi:hypothetical protein
MRKPPLYCKVWTWILLRAFHTEKNGLERGEFKTSIPEIRAAMAYDKGFVKVTPTYREIRDVIDWLRDPCAQSCERQGQRQMESQIDSSMIDIRKVTGGVVLKVRNYSFYQDPKNYEGHNEGQKKEQHEGHMEGKGQRQINKEECILKNDVIYIVFEHWNNQRIIIHRKLTDSIKGAINGRLEEGYTQADIKSAIDNYKTVLSGHEYFFTYKWTLKEFLQRDNGFIKFLPDADPLNNYKDKSIRSKSEQDPRHEEQREMIR